MNDYCTNCDIELPLAGGSYSLKTGKCPVCNSKLKPVRRIKNE